jgi:hypothetical protein
VSKIVLPDAFLDDATSHEIAQSNSFNSGTITDDVSNVGTDKFSHNLPDANKYNLSDAISHEITLSNSVKNCIRF